MTDLEAALRAIAAELGTTSHVWALVGGLAIAVRAEPRLTRDADLAVSVRDDADTEALVGDLQRAGYRILAVVDHAPSGRIATVRLGAASERSVVVDLLFASCGIEPEIVAAADRLEVLPGLVVPVARPGHLIAMKLLARDDRQRPADADDLRALAEVAQDDDWADAEQAVQLIGARGFDRGRDLVGLLRGLRPG
ncbi:MAG: nucleotidyl transferase AbiEii/AbiGii toxin family protein [Acidimicrobiales bacterium]|nr:nucleotidyl transferase AbiEii/AbiGii toxin family protein [Acidimicrobiales bacterium]